MSVLAISDHHFNHYNIIKYCNRPFMNVEEMNQYMIDKWQETVKPKDKVYYLGDFGFGGFDKLNNIITSLNGYKILILGNHDFRSGNKNFWLRAGFDEVYKQLTIGDIILSHFPVTDLKDNQINYHGHIHNNPLTHVKNINQYKNFSVEMFDYIPQIIDLP